MAACLYDACAGIPPYAVLPVYKEVQGHGIIGKKVYPDQIHDADIVKLVKGWEISKRKWGYFGKNWIKMMRE